MCSKLNTLSFTIELGAWCSLELKQRHSEVKPHFVIAVKIAALSRLNPFRAGCEYFCDAFKRQKTHKLKLLAVLHSCSLHIFIFAYFQCEALEKQSKYRGLMCLPIAFSALNVFLHLRLMSASAATSNSPSLTFHDRWPQMFKLPAARSKLFLGNYLFGLLPLIVDMSVRAQKNGEQKLALSNRG